MNPSVRDATLVGDCRMEIYGRNLNCARIRVFGTDTISTPCSASGKLGIMKPIPLESSGSHSDVDWCRFTYSRTDSTNSCLAGCLQQVYYIFSRSNGNICEIIY